MWASLFFLDFARPLADRIGLLTSSLLYEDPGAVSLEEKGEALHVCALATLPPSFCASQVWETYTCPTLMRSAPRGFGWVLVSDFFVTKLPDCYSGQGRTLASLALYWELEAGSCTRRVMCDTTWLMVLSAARQQPLLNAAVSCSSCGRSRRKGPASPWGAHPPGHRITHERRTHTHLHVAEGGAVRLCRMLWRRVLLRRVLLHRVL